MSSEFISKGSRQPVSLQTANSKTRFHELPEEVRKRIDGVNQFIKLQGQRFEQLNEIRDSEWGLVEEITQKCKAFRQELSFLREGLEHDYRICENVGKQVSECFAQMDSSSEIIHQVQYIQEQGNKPGMSLSALGFSRETTSLGEGSEYFVHLLSTYQQELNQCQKRLDELEKVLSTAEQNVPLSMEAFSRALHEENEAFIRGTARVAEFREWLDERKEEYRRYRFKVYGDRQDPFHDHVSSTMSKHVENVLPSSAVSIFPPSPQTFPSTSMGGGYAQTLLNGSRIHPSGMAPSFFSPSSFPGSQTPASSGPLGLTGVSGSWTLR